MSNVTDAWAYTQGYAKTRIYRQNYIVLRKRWSVFDKGYVA